MGASGHTNPPITRQMISPGVSLAAMAPVPELPGAAGVAGTGGGANHDVVPGAGKPAGRRGRPPVVGRHR